MEIFRVVLRRFQERISVAGINGYVVFFVFHLHPSEIAQGLLYRQRDVFSRGFSAKGQLRHRGSQKVI